MLRSIVIALAVAFVLLVQAPIRSSCLALVGYSLTETCHAATGESTADPVDDSADGDPIALGRPPARVPSIREARPLALSSGLPHKSLSLAPAEQPPRWS